MYFVYFMTNRWKSTLYIGVTSDLSNRVLQHHARIRDGFTKRYNLDRLVHWEEFSSVQLAIAREKQLKGWTRKRKETLINQSNPLWVDLSAGPTTVRRV